VTVATLVLGLTFGLGVYVAYADRSDHEEALAALRSGEIVSLREMLGEVEQRFVGQVLQVELEKEREGSRHFWIYEITLIGSDGNVSKLEFDAKTKEVLKMKGRARRRGGEQ
jgi:uncharacterized membrane protein YkoI